MITTMPAFPHQVQNLSLRSIARTSSSTRHSSHSTCMNHRGPVPLIAIMMYFATAGIPSNAPVLAATAVLK